MLHVDFRRKMRANLANLPAQKREYRKRRLLQHPNTNLIEVRMFSSQDEAEREEQSVQQLLEVIERVMMCQETILEAGESCAAAVRLQLLFIFFQSALAIVFNTYSMVIYFIRLFITVGDMELSAVMAAIFYGSSVLWAAMNVLLTVWSSTVVFNSIGETARIFNKLNLYVTDERLRARLSHFASHIAINLRKYTVYGLFSLDGSLVYTVASGTATYIIILMQYGSKGEIWSGRYYNETNYD